MKRLNHHQEEVQQDPKRIKFSSSSSTNSIQAVVITLIDLHSNHLIDENDWCCINYRKLTRQMDGLRLWTVRRRQVWDTISNPKTFHGIPIEHCRDPFTLEKSWAEGLAFNLGTLFQTDNETALEMVKRSPKCFSVLRSKDKDVILEALNTPRIVRYTDLDVIHRYLKSIQDREYAIQLITKYGKILDFLTHFEEDEEMQLLAFKHGWYITQLPQKWKELMEDKSNVMEILQTNKNIIKHIPKAMLMDREILDAIFDSVDSIDDINLIPKEILNDKEFIFKLLKKGYYFHLIRFGILKNFSHDWDFMKTATSIEPSIFTICPIDLRSQKEFALSCLDTVRESFRFIPEFLQDDRDILLQAVKSDLSVLPRLPQDILQDREKILTIIRSCENRSYTTPEFDYFKEDEEIWYELCVRDHELIHQSRFASDTNFLLRVAQKNPRIPISIDFDKLPDLSYFFRESLKVTNSAIFYYLKLYPEFFNLEEANEITGLYLSKSSDFNALFARVLHDKYNNCVLPPQALKFKPITEESSTDESEEDYDSLDSDYAESEDEDDELEDEDGEDDEYY
ncbi:predicted protein [Naegleria gruberi]|uniref:Predicted protein n=1 Tax=Naegleria gruberi TaxID=5762 RepID=D2W3N9_NAEGR|nr:uncharacterized protein NAEGRDRAFT_76012 [Naegleria gruberi]EFC36294.1 predicted protein [Naegleria gruberi]|eukprot:XP_002669038.1 predicted protein [Naegleria gruberi strain NEG-M]